MASYNPYRLDPNIAQGFSNLTRALIGSAQDDASLAQARASDARAGLYRSQAEGVNIDNARNQAYNTAVENAMGSSDLVNYLAGKMGFNNPMIQERVNTDFDPSVAMAQAPDIAFTETPTFSPEAFSGLVGALAFGQGGTANQTSQAAMNLQEMGRLQRAEELILNSDDSPARKAMM